MSGRIRNTMTAAEAEAEARKQEVMAEIESKDREEIHAHMNMLFQRWGCDTEAATHLDFSKRAFENFGLDFNAALDAGVENAGMNEVMATIQRQQMVSWRLC